MLASPGQSNAKWNEIWTWNVKSLYTSRSPNRISELPEVRWDTGGTEPAQNYTLSHVENGISSITEGILCNRTASAVKWVEFVRNRIFYKVVRRGLCHTFLKEHVLNGRKKCWFKGYFLRNYGRYSLGSLTTTRKSCFESLIQNYG